MRTKYFSGLIELYSAYPMKREVVRAKFPTGKIKKYDDFSLLVGTIDGKIDGRYPSANFLPVTRRIFFNENGSGHKCDARCTSAKGSNCECSCGGKNHGSNR